MNVENGKFSIIRKALIFFVPLKISPIHSHISDMRFLKTFYSGDFFFLLCGPKIKYKTHKSKKNSFHTCIHNIFGALRTKFLIFTIAILTYKICIKRKNIMCMATEEFFFIKNNPNTLYDFLSFFALSFDSESFRNMTVFGMLYYLFQNFLFPFECL